MHLRSLTGLRQYEELLDALSRMDVEECLKYELFKVPNFGEKRIGLMFRYGSRFIENFSVIADERRTFIDSLLSDPQLNKVCKDHLFPQDRDVKAEFSGISLEVKAAYKLKMLFSLNKFYSTHP
jgi:hypothetical protein